MAEVRRSRPSVRRFFASCTEEGYSGSDVSTSLLKGSVVSGGLVDASNALVYFATVKENRDPTLTVSLGGNTVFTSTEKWLYPLLKLESFLSVDPAGRQIDPEMLSVRDRVVGKAAALLTLRLGIGTVHAETVSVLGKSALEAAGATVTYDRQVERILCATEELLIDVDDPGEAHRLIVERIKGREEEDFPGRE